MTYTNKALLLLCICSAAGYSNASKKTQPPKKQQESTPVMNIETLPSGLQYMILKPSEEPSPKSPVKGSPVSVHYTGWLRDDSMPEKKGARFDSSHDPRRKPFMFIIGVGQVIKGWDEGVMGMKVGEKRRLFIPAALGYGKQGAGGVIPPHADLIFDVELIGV